MVTVIHRRLFSEILKSLKGKIKLSDNYTSQSPRASQCQYFGIYPCSVVFVGELCVCGDSNIVYIPYNSPF